MSAANVAAACYDKYAATNLLPTPFREDIDLLAGHFFGNGEFESLFINSLVPWNKLAGKPNEGHAAVADLLLCGAANAALSANFDTLIEQWASHRKVALRGALDGYEAVRFGRTSMPLLKFHGCMYREPEKTLWTQAQITTASISARIESCKNWMDLHLRDRDLLIVGFWTDWGYLNKVLSDALAGRTGGSVTVIDPSSATDLELKARELWTTLTGSPRFEHFSASGDQVLSEIRHEYSKVWTRKLYALGKPLYAAEKGVTCPTALLDPPVLDLEAYYDLRRDSEGVPASDAARDWEPKTAAAQTGFAHLLFSAKAPTRSGAWYELGGQKIRVVHGAGEGISSVQERFVEPSTAPEADVVVCVGAVNLGVPGSIVKKGSGGSVVRPAPGGMSRWITLDQARMEFGL